MVDEFIFFWSQIRTYIAEADADLTPAPGQVELHGRCRCGVLLSPCSWPKIHSCRFNCGNGGVRVTLHQPWPVSSPRTQPHSPSHQTRVPKINFPEFLGTGILCGNPTETPNFPEFPDLRTFSFPFSWCFFWGVGGGGNALDTFGL